MDVSQWTSPKPGEPPLHTAARLGDHAGIRHLIAAGADANLAFDMRLDPLGYEINATPLMVAAGSGDGATLQTVQLLLDLGADPKTVLNGRSAADFASRGLGNLYRPGGDAARLRLLLDVGSPLTLQGEFGARLVADTAGLGDPDRLKILLDAGASPNAQWDASAAAKRHEDLQKVIRPKMAEMLAAQNLPPEIVNLIQQTHEQHDAPPQAPDPYEIPLFQAVESDSPECVRLLLRAGTDPHQRDQLAQTAVFYASSEEVLRLLLAAGLSIDDRNKFGWTPMVAAVVDEDGELAPRRVRALIAVGANVNAADEDGYTLFMHAVRSHCRHYGVPQILLDAGADPHAVTKEGRNAFHAIGNATWGDLQTEESVRPIALWLKELGVDMERKDVHGETPLVWCIANQKDAEAKVLRELGAQPQQ